VLHNITCSCNQTLNTKYFTQLWHNTSCGVQNKAPNHASVTAHGALTLADRSQEKVLKSENCQVLLSCIVLGIYVPWAHPCSQLTSLHPTHPHYRGNGKISEKGLFNTK
jgi:hypothetical protein